MLLGIRKKIDAELNNFLSRLRKRHSLHKISPLLYQSIKEFVLRRGKRIRPTLFIIGYLGFSQKPAKNLYAASVALELLHDFLLIHDDIIDKSILRRNKPSLHIVLNSYLKRKGYKKIKFNGQDLALVIGDALYALALEALLFIEENMGRKEKAIQKFIESAFYTASGEFAELLYTAKNIDTIRKNDIYRIYDLKTAHYSFSAPLVIGATLAGAKRNQIDKLFKYGVYLGRAFQIQDDIFGIFNEEMGIDKFSLIDLQEAKKTLLIWHAYEYSSPKEKTFLKRILEKEVLSRQDLLRTQKIMLNSGTINYARKEINKLIKKAQRLIFTLGMKPRYKDLLFFYPQNIFK